MVLGLFQTAVHGMSSQSHALGVISANIANATTNGYKRTETGFASLVSDSSSFQPANPDNPAPASIQSDLGGVRAYDLDRISEAGEYAATGRALDIAIQGRGLFVMNSAVDGSGSTVYGRDGRLSETVAGTQTTIAADGTSLTTYMGYLVDKNGYFVQGWAAAADGSIDTTAPLTSLRVDPDAFSAAGESTTAATLALNLPSSATGGTVETYGIGVFDSAWQEQSVQLSFSKSADSPLLWTLSVNGSAVAELQFDGNGQISSPKTLDLALNFENGAGAGDETTAAFRLDLSGLTQYDAGFVPYDYDRDGHAPGALTGLRFDSGGDLVGIFDNGRERTLYRLAIADFVDPDGLGRLSGDVYARTSASGAARLSVAGDGGRGSIAAETLEQSNVDLEDEFSRMILTQNAYNSSATAFRTLDEMTQVAVDLYR